MKFYWTLFIIIFYSSVTSSINKLDRLPEHPRILFTNEDCELYKKSLENDSLLLRLSNAILKSSDEILELEPLGYNKIGKRLLGVSRTYLKRLFYLSYAYRITGNRKYADKAEGEMLKAASFSDWNPTHFLDVAEMTMALAIGYDWLFDVLPKESKIKIRDAIIENGIKPSQKEKYNRWLKRKHNWNQVCNAGVSFGAWAVYESVPELAEEMIDRAKKSIPLSQLDYEPDGVYVEGPGYWNYGTTFNTLFIEALNKIETSETDFEINDGFIKTGEYYLNIFGTTGSFNYFDNSSGFTLSPAIFWFAKEEKDESLVYHHLPLLEGLNDLASEGSRNRIFPMVPIWFSKLENHQRVTPNYLSWTGHGPNPVSIHRTSWEKDAIFIGIKGGKPALNHGHMDAGNFVMEVNGVRWIKDLGGHPYNKLESQGIDLWNRKQDSQRWTLFRYNNFGHNTLVINDQLQNVNASCPISEVFQEDNKRGAVIDITSAYKGLVKSANRTITIENNQYVKIADSIENLNSKSMIRWGIVTIDEIAIYGNTATIFNDGKKLKVVVKNPIEISLEEFSTTPQNDYEDDNPGTVILGFYTEIAPNQKSIIEVDLIPINE